MNIRAYRGCTRLNTTVYMHSAGQHVRGCTAYSCGHTYHHARERIIPAPGSVVVETFGVAHVTVCWTTKRIWWHIRDYQVARIWYIEGNDTVTISVGATMDHDGAEHRHVAF